MELIPILLAALVVSPAAGLAAWAWMVMAKDDEAFQASCGLKSHLSEI